MCGYSARFGLNELVALFVIVVVNGRKLAGQLVLSKTESEAKLRKGGKMVTQLGVEIA